MDNQHQGSGSGILPRPDSIISEGWQVATGFGSIVLWICAVLATYVVSVGPAAWLHDKSANPTVQSALHTVYAPAVTLINTRALKSLGAWWVYKWVDVPESRAWLHPE